MNSRVVLITGAGKGIGRAIALELCKNTGLAPAPRLFLVSRTASDLEQARSECLKAGAVDVHTLNADIGQKGAGPRVADACIAAYGRIDCLVNNAGVGKFGDLETLTEADYDAIMDTNLRGTFLLTQRVFTAMKEQGNGHIVFITSVAAERPFEQSALYCMSKYGQKGLIEVLRLYGYKHGIKVTNVLPGATLTPMWGPEVDPEMSARMMRPEDVARAVAACIQTSDRASIEELVIRPTGGDL